MQLVNLVDCKISDRTNVDQFVLAEVQDNIPDFKVLLSQHLLNRQKSNQILKIEDLKPRVNICKKTSRKSKSEKVSCVIFKRPSLETVWENLSEEDLNGSWELKDKMKVLLKEEKIDELSSLLPEVIAEDCLKWARENVAEILYDKVKVLSGESNLDKEIALLSSIQKLQVPSVLYKAKKQVDRGLYEKVKGLLKEDKLEEVKKLLPDLREMEDVHSLRAAEDLIAKVLYDKIDLLLEEDNLDEAKELLSDLRETRDLQYLRIAEERINEALKMKLSIPSGLYDEAALLSKEGKIDELRSLLSKVSADYLKWSQEIIAKTLYGKIRSLLKEGRLEEAQNLLPSLFETQSSCYREKAKICVYKAWGELDSL